MTGKKILAIERIIPLILALILVLASSITVYGEEPSINLVLDNQDLRVGNSATLTLEVRGMDGVKWKGVKGLEDFDVLGTRRGSNISIINGKMTRVSTFVYTIVPKKTGEFEMIGHIEHDGKSYESDILKVKVGKGDSMPSESTDDVFIKTNISKYESFFGEKLVVTYELYTKYRIDNYGFLEDTTFDGFIVKDIPSDDLTSSMVTIGDEQYKKYEIKKAIITPTKVGEITIPSYGFRAILSNGDFFSQGIPKDLKTNEIKVKVDEVPKTNRPDSFSGIVGEVNVNTNSSSTIIKDNEPFTLDITLQGNANLESIDELIKGDIKDFTVYQTEKEIRDGIYGGEYRAEKQYEVLLVPRKDGELKVPEIRFSYFDTGEKRYKELVVVEETVVNVSGVEGSSIPSTDSSTKTKVVVNQIEVGNTGKTDDSDYIMIKKKHVYIAIAIILIIIVIAIITWFVTKNRKTEDKALREIYNRIYLSAGIDDEYNILNEMIKYTYGISIKALSRRDISEVIENDVILGKVLSCMDIYESKSDKKDSLRDRIKDIYKIIK